jgi:uncharacterized protein
MNRITWVVKGSKFCNLRCAYCYEWNELSNRERISFEVWEKVFIAIRAHHERSVRRFGATQTSVVFHGGEPLVLPLEYLREVMLIRSRILADDPSYHNAIQTNLYRLSPRMIDFLKVHEFRVGVSVDIVPGVRRSVIGLETEPAVLANIDTLLNAGVPVGVITVLAKHTAPQLCPIYQYFAAKKIPLRILPLFEGPEGRPEELYAISNDEIVDAMQRLFICWIESGCAIPLAPFNEYLESALRKIVGVRRGMLNRREHGDSVLVVNTDARVYRLDDAYEPASEIGNLAGQTYENMIASDQYALSLVHDEAVLERMCGGCDYAGACSGWPVFASKQAGTYRGRCPIAFRIHEFIERYLLDIGFDRRELLSILATHLGVDGPRQRGVSGVETQVA